MAANPHSIDLALPIWSERLSLGRSRSHFHLMESDVERELAVELENRDREAG